MKKTTHKQNKTKAKDAFPAVKYKYFKTLGDALRLSFKDPRVFVPHLIIFIFSVIYSYFSDMVILIFFVYMLISIAAGGWFFSLLNQLMAVGKFDLKSSMKRALNFAARLLAIVIIVAVPVFVIYFFVAMAAIMLAAVGAGIAASVIGLMFMVLFIIYISAAIQIIPVLIVEDKGVMETIRLVLKFYLKKKMYALNILLISILLIFILMIPQIIFFIYLMSNNLASLAAGGQMGYTMVEGMILNLLQLPAYLGGAILYIYYCMSYKIKKKTIKK